MRQRTIWPVPVKTLSPHPRQRPLHPAGLFSGATSPSAPSPNFTENGEMRIPSRLHPHARRTPISRIPIVRRFCFALFHQQGFPTTHPDNVSSFPPRCHPQLPPASGGQVSEWCVRKRADIYPHGGFKYRIRGDDSMEVYTEVVWRKKAVKINHLPCGHSGHDSFFVKTEW